MDVFYSNIKTKGDESVSRVERREMRNAVVDYGALQPSPVPEHSSDPDNTAESGTYSVSSIATLEEPPMTPSTRTVESLSTETHGNLPPTELDFLDTSFMNDTDFEAAISNATQEFWANFPGEVELH
ncbi:MAG: hypothetical protein M1822_008872 [Bathelium mastoideum]|nr:MAG: hypothetical protein M1822_008872 [Bathelium mastoideum]